MRTRKARRWDTVLEDDPLAGLVNLFDLWMVFSIALLLALVNYLQFKSVASSAAAEADNSGTPVKPDQQTEKLDHYRISHEKLQGEGTRLGTAYQLSSGEVVYVPD